MIILDRREGDWAVLETDEGFVQVEAFRIPASAPDGAVLQRQGEAFVYDRQTTEQRRLAAREHLERLKKRPKK